MTITQEELKRLSTAQCRSYFRNSESPAPAPDTKITTINPSINYDNSTYLDGCGSFGIISNVSGYVPYTGATASVDLNSQTLNTTGTINGTYMNIPASKSNFIGLDAGLNTTGASCSNFIGSGAGNGATNASNSNFIGFQAGRDSISSRCSNFIGNLAGYRATGVTYSNFIGKSAGLCASNASLSNFLGFDAGNGATDAKYSNFLGFQAGKGATNACDSNFFGSSAGNNATNACNSNFLGFQAGKSFTSNNVGSNNTIIGTNISLPSGTTNSINIGGVLFGTGTYSTTTGDPSITGQASGKIGIGKIPTTSELEVDGTVDATTYKADGIAGVSTTFLTCAGETVTICNGIFVCIQ